MYDVLVPGQALTTQTATFTSTAIDLNAAGGTPRRGFVMNGILQAGSTAVGGQSTATFSVLHGTSTSTLRPLATQLQPGFPLTAGYSAGQIFNIPFVTNLQYVALAMTLTGATTNSSVLYSADPTFAWPW